MTADDRRFAPPHEIAGQLGQVVDPGGGFVPGLPPAPLPGALGTSSPGAAMSAMTPPLSSSSFGGPDDPRMIALAISQIAGELFNGAPGTAMAPVPTAPASVLTPSHLQLPGSPGVGPAFVPAEPLPGMSSAPTSAVPALPAAPAYGSPAMPAAPAYGSPAMPAAPAAPVDDPSEAAIARLAGEMFGGPSDAMTEILRMSMIDERPASGATPYFLPAAASAPSAAPSGGLSDAHVRTQPISHGAHGRPHQPDSHGRPHQPEAWAQPQAAGGWPDARASHDLGSLGDLRTPAHELEPVPAVIRELGQARGGTGFDPYAIRRDFPILEERVHGGKRLVWLDNAATTQKPRAVIDRLSYFYEHENSNVHRGAHTLAARSTDAYESGRESTRRFLNADSSNEIVFVRGATEGINLVAQSWGRRNVTSGDEIVVTHLEHHANIVPWQQLCAATGATLRVAPVDDRGDILLEAYERLLGPRTRLVAFPQVSNALGTVTPAREMIEIAHRHGALVLLDGAQAVSHMRVDVQALDCDFYVLSGHKVFAPTGIGAVYGKRAVLEAMPPWQGGGNMIQDVTFENTTYQAPPWRFEAGTGSIADAVGLGAALDYVMRIGLDTINRYEHELLVYAERKLATVPGLTMIGAPRDKAGVLSFVLDGQKTEAVGGALDQEGIAVRSGHHCAQPILRRFGVEASIRASLAFYNVYEDIDALVDALCRLQADRGSRPR
nr:family 2A encapsulin nanocompartment cargo protein cysteine desulfurase [Kofleriaceae bacterium]